MGEPEEHFSIDSTYNSDSLETNNADEDRDVESDFDFFAEGDTLIDICDPLSVNGITCLNNEVGELDAEPVINAEEGEIQSDPDVLSEYSDSDENDCPMKFPRYNENTDITHQNLKVGVQYQNVDVFRKFLRKHSVIHGFQLQFEKNEKKRVTAKCKNECGWRIHASSMGKSTTFQIKSLKGEPHTCPRDFRNKSVSATYLAERFKQQFVDDPNVTLRSFERLVRREVKVYAHRQKLYRAKRKAIEELQGNVKEQYYQLREYCMQILEKNPGSTAVVKVEGPPLYRNPVFQRMFIIYEAQKKGFLLGCRPVIGLDACFLKGPYGGHLMAAVSRDGNNQMFPLAMAVVESECRDSWGWFLQLLMGAIGNAEDMGWTFISDRQKGLVETFQALMPNADHRFCVRHLYANFKLRFKEREFKDLMWAAASSYLEEGFVQKMNEIKKLSVEAYEWLAGIPPQLWCKYKMSPRPKCDMLSNNLSESFNNYIKEAREQPILTMFETLRRQVMCRFQQKLEWIGKYKGKVCPRIQDKVDEIKGKALDFESFFAGEGIWEIDRGGTKYVVNLNHHTCTCRVWDVTGIPCVHATCAILTEHKPVEDYISQYYLVSQYKKAYGSMIHPIPDPNQWNRDNENANSNQLIMPPPFKKRPGRPKKARRKGPDEINIEGRVTRKGTVITCSNCGADTHNKKTCKRPPCEKQVITTRNRVTSRGTTEATTVASTNVIRGRGRPRSGRDSRGRGRGPLTGYGNWNGIGISTGNMFIPSVNQQGPSIGTTSSKKMQVQRRSTRYGDATFSGQPSSSNFTVTKDYGESEFAE